MSEQHIILLVGGMGGAKLANGMADVLPPDAPTIIVNIIFGPSNPFLSIDPTLSIKAIRRQIAERRVPCVAVSPIIGGKAVNGPAAKLMTELNLKSQR